MTDTDNTINLILVRHGNTFEKDQQPVQVGLKTNLPLTKEGKHQANELAEHFKKKFNKINVIYTGLLKRQQETASFISQAFDTPCFIESALNEIDYGLWEGQTEEAIKNKWHKAYYDWLDAAIWPKAIFNGSLETHFAKIRTWLEHLKREHAHQTVVAVTSNGIIRLFLYFSLNWPELIQLRILAQYKVKTGHYCHLILKSHSLDIKQWDLQP